MTGPDLISLENRLRDNDPRALETLWLEADAMRQRRVGNVVHLRGLIEISNFCRRRCAYCGLNVSRGNLERYRMTEPEILDCVQQAVTFGYGTVVLQAGEDPALETKTITQLVRRIKAETPLAVTLSLGEREAEALAAWREAGADRYLLRFETSDPALFASIHPPFGELSNDRMALLRCLRDLGYEIGSGVMVGIPGQTYRMLARDILTFRELDLDMVGVGPFIPHPDTPLGQLPRQTGDEQVPPSELMVYKVLALTRLVCPEANIPSTTALATLNRAQGRELGLMRGANVVMPNLTPTRYRAAYEIYPAKVCIAESAEDCSGCMRGRVRAIGREVGRGPGGRLRKR